MMRKSGDRLKKTSSNCYLKASDFLQTHGNILENAKANNKHILTSGVWILHSIIWNLIVKFSFIVAGDTIFA